MAPALILTTADAFLAYAQPSIGRYFAGFLESDIAARRPHAHTMRAYLEHLDNVPPGATIDAVVSCAAAAQRRISRMRSEIPAVMRSTSATLPWRFAFFHPLVEKGWPHTHGTVICLPLSRQVVVPSVDRAKLVELLVHERVHVLQRVHPAATREAIRQRYGPGVVPLVPRAAIPSPAERQRIYANPDVDEYEYANPAGLKRHPYEQMAYDIAAESARLDA